MIITLSDKKIRFIVGGLYIQVNQWKILDCYMHTVDIKDSMVVHKYAPIYYDKQKPLTAVNRCKLYYKGHKERATQWCSG